MLSLVLLDAVIGAIVWRGTLQRSDSCDGTPGDVARTAVLPSRKHGCHQAESPRRLRYPVYFTIRRTDAIEPPAARCRRALCRSDARRISSSLSTRAWSITIRRCSNNIAEYGQRHRTVLRLAGPVVVVPGGETVKNDQRHVDAIHRGDQRRRALPPFVRRRHRRRRGARCRRVCRGYRASRHPADSRADDGAGARRLGDGRQERRQRVRQEELSRNVRAAVCRHQRRDVPADAARPDWRAGVSEAIKAALIKDRAFFDFLEEHAAALKARDLPAMEQVIRRCAVLHLSHIASGGDPFELGSSRPLDFGHWSAHKLEQLTDHRLSHGEAVAIGIALDTTYSYLAGFLPEDDWRRIISLLPALGLLGLHARSSASISTPWRTVRRTRTACCAGSTSSGSISAAR